MGWHIIVANPIAWLLAVSNSYVLNSMITFAAETGRRLSVKAYITFIFTQVGGLIANTMTVFVLSYFMPALDGEASRHRGKLHCRTSTLSHLVVFRRREELCQELAINGEARVLHDENLTAERPSFVTHLECAYTGERYPADEVHNLSRAGKPLLVRYDLDGVRKALSKDALAHRPADLWRYREFLPVRRTQRHRQPRRGDDAADAAAEARSARAAS